MPNSTQCRSNSSCLISRANQISTARAARAMNALARFAIPARANAGASALNHGGDVFLIECLLSVFPLVNYRTFFMSKLTSFFSCWFLGFQSTELLTHFPIFSQVSAQFSNTISSFFFIQLFVFANVSVWFFVKIISPQGFVFVGTSNGTGSISFYCS